MHAPLRRSHADLMRRFDESEPGATLPDTVPSGFRSLDILLGGGFRRRELVVLGGDVGSGKSALALAIAVRAAQRGQRTFFLSGEMHEERVLERALAIEGRARLEDIRSGRLSEEDRSRVGAAALKLDRLPLTVSAMGGPHIEDVLVPPRDANAALAVVDYLQLLPAPGQRASREEDSADAVCRLKSIALGGNFTILVVSQLPGLDPARSDPRPRLEDYGRLGAVKQHADVVLSLFREEMYRTDPGIAGATELLVGKNRGGPTGALDLYFHSRWMRFEDMYDPDG